MWQKTACFYCLFVFLALISASPEYIKESHSLVFNATFLYVARLHFTRELLDLLYHGNLPSGLQKNVLSQQTEAHLLRRAARRPPRPTNGS